MKEQARARTLAIPHRAHLGTVPRTAARKRSTAPFRLPQISRTGQSGLRKLVQVLVFGCAYDRIADGSCSATTLRRRRGEWIDCGVMESLQELALEAYDRVIGLRLGDVAVDGYITKAPCGGERAGKSPVDRGKQDRGYDSDATRKKLDDRGLIGVISEKGKPTPLAAGKRWIVERTNSWHNAFKKLLWCTERRGRVIDFWIAFSNVIIVVRRLMREAWTHYRWETDLVADHDLLPIGAASYSPKCLEKVRSRKFISTILHIAEGPMR